MILKIANKVNFTIKFCFLYAVCQNVYNKLSKKYNSLCFSLFFQLLARAGASTSQIQCREQASSICSS